MLPKLGGPPDAPLHPARAAAPCTASESVRPAQAPCEAGLSEGPAGACGEGQCSEEQGSARTNAGQRDVILDQVLEQLWDFSDSPLGQVLIGGVVPGVCPL